jgi:hypothetical protein
MVFRAETDPHLASIQNRLTWTLGYAHLFARNVDIRFPGEWLTLREFIVTEGLVVSEIHKNPDLDIPAIRADTLRRVVENGWVRQDMAEYLQKLGLQQFAKVVNLELNTPLSYFEQRNAMNAWTNHIHIGRVRMKLRSIRSSS